MCSNWSLRMKWWFGLFEKSTEDILVLCNCPQKSRFSYLFCVVVWLMQHWCVPQEKPSFWYLPRYAHSILLRLLVSVQCWSGLARCLSSRKEAVLSIGCSGQSCIHLDEMWAFWMMCSGMSAEVARGIMQENSGCNVHQIVLWYVLKPFGTWKSGKPVNTGRAQLGCAVWCLGGWSHRGSLAATLVPVVPTQLSGLVLILVLALVWVKVNQQSPFTQLVNSSCHSGSLY